MNWRDGRSLLMLPGTVLVLIPLGVMWWTGSGFSNGAIIPLKGPLFWLALLVGACGLFFLVWTVGLFRAQGEGTLAPWDPPKRLVVAGPYRHVRNPMISGVTLILFAEALLFNSFALIGWLLLFFAANAVWFVLVEEPGLERRFGESYRRYKENVPRWIPRASSWTDPEELLGNGP